MLKQAQVVISYLKKQVLRDLVIVLSGVVPLGVEPERCDAYRLCIQFGARVDKKITEHTTHVIAARWGTELVPNHLWFYPQNSSKVHLANKMQIPVVSSLWLYSSIEQWHKADEKEFELTKDFVPPKGTPKGGHLIPEIHCIDTIKKTDLLDMSNEVDAALSDEDDDEEDDKEETVENEEEEEMKMDGHLKKRKANDDEAEDFEVESSLFFFGKNS